MANALKIGTKVRTLYEHSETGMVVKPRKSNLPLPSPDWLIVQFDHDGARMCINRSMLAVSNQ